MSERKAMIDKADPAISVSAQNKLLGISRSGLYYLPCGEREENLAILRLLDEQYMKTPFYRKQAFTEFRLNRRNISAFATINSIRIAIIEPCAALCKFLSPALLKIALGVGGV